MNIEMMNSLVGEALQIDRGGPESRVGKLLGVGDDYFTLATKQDGLIIYKTHHIKSITQNVKKGVEFNLLIPEDLEFISAANFIDTISSLKYKWVKVNRGGKESVEGILENVTDDFITVVANEEIIRISMFHVRNISFGLVFEEQKNEESAKESKENNKEKESK